MRIANVKKGIMSPSKKSNFHFVNMFPARITFAVSKQFSRINQTLLFRVPLELQNLNSVG